MRLILGVVLALAALPPAARAFVNGEPVNDVEAAYLAKKTECAGIDAHADRARCLEAFAANEARAQSTTTGLKGQVGGLGNYPPAEAWAWNNAGHCWMQAGHEALEAGNRTEAAGHFAAAIKAYQSALLTDGIAPRCEQMARAGAKAGIERKAEAEKPPAAPRKTTRK